MIEDDSINIRQAMQDFNSKKWTEAMKEEYMSMHGNKVWELIPLPEGVKPIGCKWFFKTRRDSNGNMERYRVHLMANGYIQKEEIDFKKTIYLVSLKESFRTIMTLVEHYDLELQQMDVNTIFLNGNVDEQFI